MKPLTRVMTLVLLLIIGSLFIYLLLVYGPGHTSILQILLMLVGAIATGLLLFVILYELFVLGYAVWRELRPRSQKDLPRKD